MRKGFIVLLAVVVLLAGGAGLFLVWMQSQAVDQPAPTADKKPPASPAGEFRNEAHWLASEVVREMARWVVLSGGPAKITVTPGGSDVVYTVDGMAGELRIAQHIWSPEDYLPVARMMLAKVIPPTSSTPSSSAHEAAENFATALLNPTTEVMLARDAALSERLAQAPGDPDLHEQAALLCATLAFREASGRFCDPRRELCAATAHLALARARRAESGVCARIASALIDTIAIREVAALTAAEGLPATGPLAGWRRAVQVRATGEWPKSTIGLGASMVEQLAHFRALVHHQDDAVAAAWLDQAEPLATSDWGWVMCETTLSVENGHRFAREGLAQEFEELGTLWQHVHRRAMTESDLVAALALSDNGEKPMRVLSIKRWSTFLERHRSHRLVKAHEFMENSWGDKESAQELRTLCSGPLASSPLMPLVRMQFKQDPQYIDQARKAAEMVGRDPALLTAWLWANFRFGANAGLMPRARDWWSTIAAPGTALHASVRADMLTKLQYQVRDQVEQVLMIAPHNAGLKYSLARLRDLKDVAALTALFGEQVEWDLNLAQIVARSAKPGAERLAAFRRMATMHVDWNIQLARELVQAKNEQEAVLAYEAAYKDSADRVLIANSMSWLVSWYADHGNMTRARIIADHGYEVFSSSGIETKAKLDERLGDLDGAEKAPGGAA